MSLPSAWSYYSKRISHIGLTWTPDFSQRGLSLFPEHTFCFLLCALASSWTAPSLPFFLPGRSYSPWVQLKSCLLCKVFQDFPSMNPSASYCLYYPLTINRLLVCYYCFSTAVFHHHLELISSSLRLDILAPLLQKHLEVRVCILYVFFLL